MLCLGVFGCKKNVFALSYLCSINTDARKTAPDRQDPSEAQDVFHTCIMILKKIFCWKRYNSTIK